MPNSNCPHRHVVAQQLTIEGNVDKVCADCGKTIEFGPTVATVGRERTVQDDRRDLPA